MKRRHFLSAAGVAALPASAQQGASAPQQLHPGVWRFRVGAPEKITPTATRHYAPASMSSLPVVNACPVGVTGKVTGRGCLVRIPLAQYEMVYGLGLQLQSFLQRGLKKKLRVNADPQMDSGDSHAPVPFYVTTAGYGVLVDTARYATFYCGNKYRKGEAQPAASAASAAAIGADALPAAYQRFAFDRPSEVYVEIPEARGIDVYVFGGPDMRSAVQRYNLFSGGGALPPRWGLGIWYRAKSDYRQDQVIALADEFRKQGIPLDVIGLEPGWQTHAYSCTYLWSKNYPDPAAMLRELAARHLEVNLWEHAFTHPDSPIHQALLPYSGDFEVWGGLVPDFLMPAARRIFAGFHEKTHVAIGVSGYKLDECDNSDFTRNWSFPEFSQFPSGADGEQMHCLFGLRYQDTIQSIFDTRKQRTYGLVRSSQALAAPYPYVLYSDLYDHREFIRGLVNAGFSGLLWTPELRDARSTEDLIRRLQSVALSPMALINAWYIQHPPWKQVDREQNNAGQFSPDWESVEAKCRAIMELRMRLVPYLHAAFVRYHREGLPPFRALVLDYPKDAKTWTVEDQYLIGDSLMAAPVVAGQTSRNIYLPEGEWVNFWTGERHPGKQQISVEAPLERIPLFVKGNALLPLADPAPHTADPASFRLTVHVYAMQNASATLYHDSGEASPVLTPVMLQWDAARQAGSIEGPAYSVVNWKIVG
ncbi:MAG TPA: TIM-barrel domain-containing protein [Bryobacteraceae bacterium]|nr:TIM-barrel domain-containing protein [Bryobacteraceae bacterium]